MGSFQYTQSIKILSCYIEKAAGDRGGDFWYDSSGKVRYGNKPKSHVQQIEDSNYSTSVDSMQRRQADLLKPLVDNIANKEESIDRWKKESGYNKLKFLFERSEKIKKDPNYYPKGGGANAAKISREDRGRFSKKKEELKKQLSELDRLKKIYRDKVEELEYRHK